jgi:hypothetical protein
MTIGIGQEASGNSRKLKFLLCAIGAMVFALCVPAHAQRPGKTLRIGYLDPSTASGTAVLVAGATGNEVSICYQLEGCKTNWSDSSRPSS